MQNLFEKVISPPVAHHLLNLEDPNKHEEHLVAVMFVDLCHFTCMTEQFPIQDIITMLNSYFTNVVEVIKEHNGIIDKFIGDAVMAIFNFENDDEMAAQRAVEASLAILESIKSVTTPQGEPISVSIGINYGPVCMGLVGAPDRYEYTVIGDTVNVASRLEGASKYLEHAIIVSEDTFARLLPELQQHFDNLGEYYIRGKQHPLHLFGIQ